MAQPDVKDGVQVELLEGNEHGQVGEIVTLSKAVAEAEIAANHAAEVA